jgi:hypothetical protein
MFACIHGEQADRPSSAPQPKFINFLAESIKQRTLKLLHLSDSDEKTFETAPVEAGPVTSPALDAPLRSLREALDETLADIDRELVAVRRLYGLIDRHYRRVLELQQRAAMLKMEIQRRS